MYIYSYSVEVNPPIVCLGPVHTKAQGKSTHDGQRFKSQDTDPQRSTSSSYSGPASRLRLEAAIRNVNMPSGVNQHPAWILDDLLDLLEENDSLTPINEPVAGVRAYYKGHMGEWRIVGGHHYLISFQSQFGKCARRVSRVSQTIKRERLCWHRATSKIHLWS